jgi:Dehydrogenases (flavoproteins)
VVKNYDVAIIGGGPAGSTAATLLSKAGRRVIVLEREKFPRFHIGESLLPFSMQTFTRLGLQEKLRAHFVEKFGGEIAEAGGEKAAKFYFKDGFASRTDRSYQVTRSKFDKMMLDHAGESGAEICEETSVDDVTFHDDGVTLRIRDLERAGAGDPGYKKIGRELSAKFLIDASGRNSVVGNKFKLKRSYQHLQKLSLFAHYEGLEREAGIDATLTRMVRTLDSWFWVIPLENDRTSIGIVLEAADFKKSGLSAEEFFERAIAEQPLVRNRIGDGRAFHRYTPRRIFLIGARSSLVIAGCSRVMRPVSLIRFSAAASFLPSSPASKRPMFCTKCSIIRRGLDACSDTMNAWSIVPWMFTCVSWNHGMLGKSSSKFSLHRPTFCKFHRR